MSNQGFFSLLEQATTTWGDVQTENEAQRHLVTSLEWESYEEFNTKVVKQLKDAIAEFGSTGKLSETSVSSLNGILDAVKQARRLDEAALLQRRSEQAERLLKNFKH